MAAHVLTKDDQDIATAFMAIRLAHHACLAIRSMARSCLGRFPQVGSAKGTDWTIIGTGRNLLLAKSL